MAREAHLRREADRAAQRYVDERRLQQASGQGEDQIWANARMVAKGIRPPSSSGGRVDNHGFADEWRAHPERVPKRVRAAFEAFDVNRSGYLDYRELRNALNYCGFDVSDVEAQGVLRAYDDHPDGKLDLIEVRVRSRPRALLAHPKGIKATPPPPPPQRSPRRGRRGLQMAPLALPATAARYRCPLPLPTSAAVRFRCCPLSRPSAFAAVRFCCCPLSLLSAFAAVRFRCCPLSLLPA